MLDRMKRATFVRTAAASSGAGIEKIDYVVVIYKENWSNDGFYGKFPASNNRASVGQVVLVDHTRYETISILKFIEMRWHLPLCARDASANGLTNAFDFSQQPRPLARSPTGPPTPRGQSTASGRRCVCPSIASTGSPSS
jgi:hypothetical protein